MRLLLTASLIACACALAAPALAEDTVVPVEKAPYHRPVFHNDLVMLLSVYLPPGAPRGPEVYHTHSLDQISVLAQAADMTNQALGEPAMGPARRGQRGNVGYTAFSKKPQTHRGANVGSTPFHNIVVGLLYPQPGRFTAGSRAEAPAYQQLIDNDNVRAWRLTRAGSCMKGNSSPRDGLTGWLVCLWRLARTPGSFAWLKTDCVPAQP